MGDRRTETKLVGRNDQRNKRQDKRKEIIWNSEFSCLETKSTNLLPL